MEVKLAAHPLPPGRARTADDRRRLVERLLAAWDKVPSLRLGQFIQVAAESESPPLTAFVVEDEELVGRAERVAATSAEVGR